METWAKNQLQFVERKRKLGISDALNHADVIKKRISARTNLGVAESNRLGDFFEKSGLREKNKTELAAALVEVTQGSKRAAPAKAYTLEDLTAVELPGVAASARHPSGGKVQKHEYFYNYFTEAEYPFLA